MLNIGELIERLPKIELHCHIDGSIRPSTILEICKKENIFIPTENIDKFKALVQVSKSCSSLKEYLEKFEYNIKVMQKEEHIRRIVLELLEDQAKVNVKYIELRCSPFLHMEGGLSFDEVNECILSAMKEGETKYKVASNLILICMRNHNPLKSLEVVELGRKYLGRGVIALDLAGNEEEFPPELHKEAFMLAEKYGFHRTVHAAEVNLPENIIKAVEELKAERIGHGVNSVNSREVLEFVKRNRLPLEICVTSNAQTHAVESMEKHPVKDLLEEGIPVTINTDNITVSNITLNDEYKVLYEKFGFTTYNFCQIISNSINACFASTDEKRKLIDICNEDLKAISVKYSLELQLEQIVNKS